MLRCAQHDMSVVGMLRNFHVPKYPGSMSRRALAKRPGVLSTRRNASRSVTDHPRWDN